MKCSVTPDKHAETALRIKAAAFARQVSAVLDRLEGQAYSSTLSALNDLKAELRSVSPPQRGETNG